MPKVQAAFWLVFAQNEDKANEENKTQGVILRTESVSRTESVLGRILQESRTSQSPGFRPGDFPNVDKLFRRNCFIAGKQ